LFFASINARTTAGAVNEYAARRMDCRADPSDRNTKASAEPSGEKPTSMTPVVGGCAIACAGSAAARQSDVATAVVHITHKVRWNIVFLLVFALQYQKLSASSAAYLASCVDR